jgi:oligopeptidase B
MTVDDTHRPYRLYKHVLGSSADDQLVLEETDMAFYSNLGKSRDDKFIFLNSSSNVTSEVKYLDANKPDSDWKLVYPRKQNVEVRRMRVLVPTVLTSLITAPLRVVRR